MLRRDPPDGKPASNGRSNVVDATAVTGEKPLGSPIADAARSHAHAALPVEPAAGSAADAIECELITTVEELAPIAGTWDALLAAAGRQGQPFQSFAWHSIWCRHYIARSSGQGRGGSQLAIVVVRRAGEIEAIWPLALTRQAGLKRLSFAGEPVSQYADVIARPGPALPALLEASFRHVLALTKPDIAAFRKVRDDALVAPLLRANGAYRSDVQQALSADLAAHADFEAYMGRFSTRARRNRRRQMRRLEDLGTVSFERAQSGASAQALAREIIELKRRWLAERNIFSPAVTDARFMDFFIEAAASTGLRTDTLGLRSGGKLAAGIIMVQSGDWRAMHVIAFDAAFDSAAPGALLIEEAVRHAYEDGVQRFDQLAPDARYKREWCDDAVGIADYAIPCTVIAHAYQRVVLGMVRPFAKRLAEQAPIVLRRLGVQRSRARETPVPQTD